VNRIVDLFQDRVSDFWAEQAVRMGREMPAAELTR
jgi:hypothetical protein